MESGYFAIMNETQRIPVVAVTLDTKVKKFNEFDVSNKVREKGWVLSAYSMPPDAQEVRSLRVVVRPHINHNVVMILARGYHQCVQVSRAARRQRDGAGVARAADKDLASEVLRALPGFSWTFG